MWRILGKKYFSNLIYSSLTLSNWTSHNTCIRTWHRRWENDNNDYQPSTAIPSLYGDFIGLLQVALYSAASRSRSNFSPKMWKKKRHIPHCSPVRVRYGEVFCKIEQSFNFFLFVLCSGHVSGYIQQQHNRESLVLCQKVVMYSKWAQPARKIETLTMS